MSSSDVIGSGSPGTPEIFSDRIHVLGTHANITDPVQMLQNVVSDQGQHCLPTGISMQSALKMKMSTIKP